MTAWELLSAIDVNEFVEKKGNFSYLAWTEAWAQVKKHYPDATYTLESDVFYEWSKTMEVRVSVTIDGLTHMMWLPVLDHKNKPIENPASFDINTARMRCLTKCLAMHGLGHYIYAGESAPAAPSLSHEVRDRLLREMQGDNEIQFGELYLPLSDEHKAEFAAGFSQGHISAQKQLVRDLVGRFTAVADQYVDDITAAIKEELDVDVRGNLEDLKGTDALKAMVWAKLDDSSKAYIRGME